MCQNNCWLPSLNSYDFESDYNNYESELYRIYKRDFIDSKPIFEGREVYVRFHPKVDGYEESFIHFTCKDYEKTHIRNPDFRRCERLHWIRKVIENYMCKSSCLHEECNGILVWEEPWGKNIRVHFLFIEERYTVILEKKERVTFLITAYYLEYNNTLEKQLKHYNQFKKAKDASLNGTSSGTPSTTSR